MSTQSFQQLGVSELLSEHITALGFLTATPIQQAAIPELLAGHDVVGQAATGTGKTAAFGLPLIQKLMAKKSKSSKTVEALILTPTRELALQVLKSLQSYTPHRIPMTTIYGGTGFNEQIRALKDGAKVVVGTPGRCLDMVRQGLLKLQDVETLVLDEADEMLKMGFIEDIDEILKHVPKTRQTALFSATFVEGVVRRIPHYTNAPVHISIKKTETTGKPLVHQKLAVVPNHLRLTALFRLIEQEDPSGTIVFARTREEADHVALALEKRGHKTAPLHGGLSQNHREKVLGDLRSGRYKIIVATDVAGRGLDIEGLSHVFNLDVPKSPSAYVHRIGRVGRAGRTGTSITVAGPMDVPRIRDIERLTQLKMEAITIPTGEELKKERLLRLKKSIETLQPSQNTKFLVEELSQTLPMEKLFLAALTLPPPSFHLDRADDQEDIPLFTGKPNRREHPAERRMGRRDEPRKYRERDRGPRGKASKHRSKESRRSH